MLDRRRLAGLACFGLSLHALPIENATAQSYPSRPIRMVVPSSPGGGNDINARILAPTLAEMLGVSVLIDNRAGGGTVIGTDIVDRKSTV